MLLHPTLSHEECKERLAHMDYFRKRAHDVFHFLWTPHQCAYIPEYSYYALIISIILEIPSIVSNWRKINEHYEKNIGKEKDYYN